MDMLIGILMDSMRCMECVASGIRMEECYLFCMARELCVSSIWFRREERRKLTF